MAMYAVLNQQFVVVNKLEFTVPPHSAENIYVQSDTATIGQFWNGISFVDDPDLDYKELQRVKDSAILNIDLTAERERLKFISGGTGQAMEYVYTALEAEKFMADTAPDPSNYPFLMAEISAQMAAGITDVNLTAVITQIMYEQGAWRWAGSNIKRMRRTAKLRVQQATTKTEVQNILASLDWSIPMPPSPAVPDTP